MQSYPVIDVSLHAIGHFNESRRVATRFYWKQLYCLHQAASNRNQEDQRTRLKHIHSNPGLPCACGRAGHEDVSAVTVAHSWTIGASV